MVKMSVATAKIKLSKEMRNEMNEDLITCEHCEKLGKFAPNLFGKVVFFHKIPSPRLAGYYTFTETCQFI